MSLGTAAILAGAFLTVTAGTTHAQSTDPCTLVPASYNLIENPTPQTCVVSYWQRVSEKIFGGLREFGAYVAIDKTGSVETAKEKFATYAAARPGWTQTAYGDGGVEVIEDPTDEDHRIPSATETATKTQRGRPGDLIGKRIYATIFRCGPNLISVFANPSRGADARGLVAELESKFRSGGV